MIRNFNSKKGFDIKSDKWNFYHTVIRLFKIAKISINFYQILKGLIPSLKN